MLDLYSGRDVPPSADGVPVLVRHASAGAVRGVDPRPAERARKTMSAPARDQPKRPPRGGHKPKKTATLLAQRIVSEIASGRLAPGTPLLPEKEMVETYQVSRGTLRETLRFLEIQGVIAMKTGPGGGPVVAGPESRHLANTIAMMLELEGASFQTVLQARGTLEPALAGLAATNVTPEQLQRLRESVGRMMDHSHDAAYFLAENEIFHSVVAEAADNPVFSLMMASLNWIIDGTRLGVEYTDDQRSAVARQHAKIVAAIEAGDAAAATAAMTKHIGEFARFLKRHYPALVDASIRWADLD